MKEQLIQYVNLLFAGTQGCEDIRQEILQNTLDRYDDLIDEGKVPEAAYRLAITGIGDINEILGTASTAPLTEDAEHSGKNMDTPGKKLLRAIAVGLYILCPLPLFILSETGMSTLGLCGTLAIVAVATVLIMLGGKRTKEDQVTEVNQPENPKSELRKSIESMISSIGLAVYLILSIFTGAWHITWLCFPIIGAVKGLVNAIMDLKEANTHEK